MKTLITVIIIWVSLAQPDFFQKNGHKPVCSTTSDCESGLYCNSLGLCTKNCTSHASCENPNLECDFMTTPYTCRQKGCVH